MGYHHLLPAQRLACAVALALSCMGAAQAADLAVGRTVMQLPPGVEVLSVELNPRDIPGDGHLVAKRRLVRVEQAGQPASHLVIASVHGRGDRFEWSGSCRTVKPSAKVFVYSPFHTVRDQCVVVQGPYELGGSLEVIDEKAAQAAASQQWTVGDEGYIVHAKHGLESGALLSVTAFIPIPFAGLPVTGALPPHSSDVPAPVIAWALALEEQVRTGVQSLSGKWQLPPIKQQ
ncbi:MAG TPA: hypothetical protein VGD46_02610 [Rhizobacter sp.]